MIIGRLPFPAFAPLLGRALRFVPVVVALVLFTLVITGIASSYFGDSASPYDTCFGANGRAVSCRVLQARQ
jgi:hypothetical protein